MQPSKIHTNIQITEIEPGVYTRTSPNSNYIIEYHKDICIGAGSCAAIASNTFVMNSDNIAEFVVAENEDDDELILAAAQSCPVFAIIIKNKLTGEQVFPPVG